MKKCAKQKIGIPSYDTEREEIKGEDPEELYKGKSIFNISKTTYEMFEKNEIYEKNEQEDPDKETQELNEMHDKINISPSKLIYLYFKQNKKSIKYS